MSRDDRITGAFQISSEHSDQRLDKVAATLMPEHSRSRIQGWIKSGELLVNGKQRKPRDRVMIGDQIEVSAEPEVQVSWEAEDIELDILYEDEDILVINKPAGLVVHPAAGHWEGILVNALLHHAPEVENLPRAGVVHRLDKDTSGVMVVARSLIAHTSLVDQLQNRTMGREYDAVINGTLTGGGVVDEPIGRHPTQRKKMAVVPDGKPAVTHYRIAQRFAAHTHVTCRLESGRTHQIRVHMAHIRHPLVGDPVYGGRMKLPPGASPEMAEALRHFRRQALHARRLRLHHPRLGEDMTWEAPLPEDMVQLIELLEAATQEAQTP